MKKLMGLKLDLMEMERVAGGAVGPVCNKPHNETGPLGTGPLGYPYMTNAVGPVRAVGPVCNDARNETGPLGYVDGTRPHNETGPLGTGPLNETGPLRETGPLGCVGWYDRKTGPLGYPY